MSECGIGITSEINPLSSNLLNKSYSGQYVGSYILLVIKLALNPSIVDLGLYID